MVLDESWLLNLGILRPGLLQLNEAERNRAKPYKEKQNANDLFVHELDPSLTVMAEERLLREKPHDPDPVRHTEPPRSSTTTGI